MLRLVRDKPNGILAQDMIKALRLPRASGYQILAVLVREGFLTVQQQSGRYLLGRQCYLLGLGYRGDAALIREAKEVLQQLRNETGETAQLSILDRSMNLLLLREEGHGRLAFILPVGSKAPVNWSASGCLLIADWPDEEIRKSFPHLEASPTRLAPTTTAALLQEVHRYRKQGFAVKIGHIHDKVANIAAPVVDRSGKCVAAITLVVYELSLTSKRKRELIDAVCKAGRQLGERLSAE